MLERVIPALDAAAGVFRRRASGLCLRHISAPAAAALSNRSECAPLLLDVLYVITSLAIFILLIATLGALGAGVGLDVAPIGEDYNWLYLLQRGSGADTARLFWAADGRNPLSPWWYIAARKIIFEFDAGLLMLRYMMAAVLALSLYCMVVTVAGRQSRLFALSLAILTVFWMANRYTDQVLWNFHGALSASLISVAAYAQFIDSGRRTYFLYAVSIIAWFLAFATYTLQCGAVLAIGYLALRRTPAGSFGSQWLVVKRISVALTDTAPYLALFGFFLLLWRTTIDPIILNLLSPLHFTIGGLLASLREGIWTSDLTIFYLWIANSPDRAAFFIAALVCGLVAFVALQLRQRLPGTALSIISAARLADVLVVLICIAAPTIALESSSQSWPAGTRWPMLYQVTTPALLLVILAFVLTITTAPSPLRCRLWIAGVSLGVAIGAVFSLGHNRVQIDISRNESFVRDSMMRIIAEDLAMGYTPPLQVLLMLDVPNRSKWRSTTDTLSPVMARIWLHRDDISFRFIPWFQSDFFPWWRVQFGPDSAGVGNAKTLGGTIPYERIRILRVREHTAWRISAAGKDDFAGFEIEWNRDGPIALPAIDPSRLCPLLWSADRDILSQGWSIPERDEKGPVRWTISPSARLTFPAACQGRSNLRVVVANAASTRDIADLSLRVNGQKVPYRRRSEDGNVIYDVDLSAKQISSSPILNIDFVVGGLDFLGGTTRKFGVAVRRVEIRTVNELSDGE